MIFRVNIGYNRFDIPDNNTAMSFAELAKTYIVQDKTYNVDVSIDLIDREDEIDD